MDPQLLTQQNAESCCWKSKFSFILIAPRVFLKEVFSVLFCSTSTCLHSMAKENNSSLRSFADDMTLYHSDTSAEHASKTVYAALNIINDESVDLGLPINIEKSAALHICPSAKKSNHLPSWRSYRIVGPYNCSPQSDVVINSLLRRYSWRN